MRRFPSWKEGDQSRGGRPEEGLVAGPQPPRSKPPGDWGDGSWGSHTDSALEGPVVSEPQEGQGGGSLSPRVTGPAGALEHQSGTSQGVWVDSWPCLSDLAPHGPKWTSAGISDAKPPSPTTTEASPRPWSPHLPTPLWLVLWAPGVPWNF